MVKPIPKWIWKCYAKLWQEFKDKEFKFEDLYNVLKNKYSQKNILSVMISELKQAGWISVSLDDTDARKRFYTLSNPIKIVEDFKHERNI